MRKWYVLLLSALCIVLCSCSNENSQKGDMSVPTPVTGRMADNKYMITTAISFQETDSFFCGSNLTGNYINYYDKVSGVSGVLCADPACSHNSAECSAYIESGATLSVYEGKLYWVAPEDQSGGDYYLVQSNAAGTERKKVKRIDYENVVLPLQPQRYVIHQGTLYLFGQASVVDGVQAGCRLSLLATPLDSSEEYTTIFDNIYEQGAQATVRFIGDEIYLSVVCSENEECDISIYKYRVNEEENEIIYSETGIGKALGAIWVTENGDIFLPGADQNCTYVWQIKDGNRETVASQKISEPSIPIIIDGIAINLYSIKGVRWIDIVNLAGESIYSGELFEGKISEVGSNPNDCGVIVIGGDSEKIIFNLQEFGSNQFVDYTVMLNLENNMELSVLWSSQN